MFATCWATREFVADAEVVYHLAALIAIPYSYRAPTQLPRDERRRNDERAGGGAAAWRRRAWSDTSTSEVYGTAVRVPIDEEHPLQAQSPYSATKVAADKLAESYHVSFGVPVVTVRPFNAYGPRQSTRAVIPTIITQLAAGNEQVALGALTPTRDLTMATDTARAFMAAGRAPLDTVVWPRPECGIGERDLDRRACSADRGKDGTAAVPCRRAGGTHATGEVGGSAPRLRLDAAAQPDRLGATSSLDTGLDETIAWFVRPENLARYRAGAFTL